MHDGNATRGSLSPRSSDPECSALKGEEKSPIERSVRAVEAEHAVLQKGLLNLGLALLAGGSHLVLASAGCVGRVRGKAGHFVRKNFIACCACWRDWFGTWFPGDIYLVFDARGALFVATSDCSVPFSFCTRILPYILAIGNYESARKWPSRSHG